MKKWLMLAATLLASTQVSAYEITKASDTPSFEYDFRIKNGATGYRWYKQDDCSKDCRMYLRAGGTTYQFKPDSTIQAVSMYKHETYVMVKEPIKDSDKSLYHFISANKKQRNRFEFENLCGDGFDAKGNIVCVIKSKGKLQVVSQKGHLLEEYPLPFKNGIAATNNNLAGTFGIALINIETKELAYTNLYNARTKESPWQTYPTFLHDRSDTRGILSVYPVNRSKAGVAVYEYVSVLNKGVNLYEFDDEGESYRVVTNNDDHIWGSELEMFFENGQYVLTGEHDMGGSDSVMTYRVDESQLAEDETYVNDNSSASQFEFMAGYGLQYNNWIAWQTFEGASHDYNIDPAFLHSLYFQGRIKDTQLSLKYLGDAAGDVAEGEDSIGMLMGLADFDGFFKGADTLRLQFDWLETTGTSTYKATDSRYCIDDVCEFAGAFEASMFDIKALILREGGNFWGLSYKITEMPHFVEVVDHNDNVEFMAYDEDYSSHKVSFMLGRDAAAFAARYALDYDGFYFLPTFSVSGIYHQFSDGLVEQLDASGEKVNVGGASNLTFGVGATLDLGYIHQRRWVDAKGLGYSIQGGIKGTGEYSFGSPFFGGANDQGELGVNVPKVDINWGPYIAFNMLF